MREEGLVRRKEEGLVRRREEGLVRREEGLVLRWMADARKSFRGKSCNNIMMKTGCLNIQHSV